MIRSVWCKKCKKIVNTVVISGKESCPDCGGSVYRSTAGGAATITGFEEENE